MHVAHTSAETAERRRQKVDDVAKRAQYRRAHGLDKNEGLGGWTAKENAPAAAAEVEGYVDFEGKRKPIKKWLGIW